MLHPHATPTCYTLTCYTLTCYTLTLHLHMLHPHMLHPHMLHPHATPSHVTPSHVTPSHATPSCYTLTCYTLTCYTLTCYLTHFRMLHPHMSPHSNQHNTSMECIRSILDWSKMAKLMECSYSIAMQWVSAAVGRRGLGWVWQCLGGYNQKPYLLSHSSFPSPFPSAKYAVYNLNPMLYKTLTLCCIKP